MPWTGSLTSLSLSLMMRLGNPDIVGDNQRLLGHEEVSYARVSLVQVVFVGSFLFAGVGSDVMMFAPVQVQAEARMSDPGPHVHLAKRGGCLSECAKWWI
jgi:hypothetical protein